MFQAYKQVALGDGAVTGFTVPDWEGGTIGSVLHDSADTAVAPDTMQDLVEIAGAGRVALANLANVGVTATGGTATVDADDTTYGSVTGDQAEEVILYSNTGTEATSLLLVYFDTFSSGMPVTPNGGDITIQWNASGIWSW